MKPWGSGAWRGEAASRGREPACEALPGRHCLPRSRRPVGSRLVFGASLRAVEDRGPLQLIGLMSGVITGVTAGAMGFMGAADFTAGLRRAAFLAGFFLEAFFEAFLEDFFADFFFEDFFEDFFFAAFFLEDFFFATRFFADFFFAVFFLAVFFFAAFFFAAMFNSFGCWTDVCRARGPGGASFRTTKPSIRTERDW